MSYMLTAEYPAYDDYHKRYYNYDNYYHFNNEKSRQNMSPIILFKDSILKKTSNVKKSMNSVKPQKEFLTEKSNPKIKNSKEYEFGKWSTKTIVKALFILGCWAVTCYQTVFIIEKYASFPMDVNVIVQEMKFLQLPGITVCNNNIIHRKNLKDDLEEDGENLNTITNGSDRELFKYTKQFIMNNTVHRILSLSPSVGSFVDDLECDAQLDPKAYTGTEYRKLKQCDEKEVIQTLQKNGICYTYFHKMAKEGGKDKACRALGNCPPKEPSFDVNEVARFELNFEPHQYTNKDLPISGTISIHDNTEIGDSLSNSYNLEPGYYYQFFIKVQSTSMMKKPYSTNCLDYLEKNKGNFKMKRDFTTTEFSRKQCSSLCMGKFVSNCGNCWPPEFPYIKGNELDLNRTYKWCNWKYKMKSGLYASCVKSDRRMNCSSNCQPSCWADHYEVTVQKLSFEYYGREEWSSDNKDKKGKSVVSIRYWSTERTIHEYSPLFTILDMVCYVGGLVSMYTGLSLVAVYDYFTVFFYFSKKYMNSR